MAAHSAKLDPDNAEYLTISQASSYIHIESREKCMGVGLSLETEARVRGSVPTAASPTPPHHRSRGSAANSPRPPYCSPCLPAAARRRPKKQSARAVASRAARGCTVHRRLRGRHCALALRVLRTISTRRSTRSTPPPFGCFLSLRAEAGGTDRGVQSKVREEYEGMNRSCGCMRASTVRSRFLDRCGDSFGVEISFKDICILAAAAGSAACWGAITKETVDRRETRDRVDNHKIYMYTTPWSVAPRPVVAIVGLSPKTLNREENISSRHTVHRALSGAPLQHEVADHTNQRVCRGAVRR